MQQNYKQAQQAGLGIAAISYDSPAILKNFAQRRGIEFPLLADPDSKIIRSFGILNTQLQAGSPNYGIPYPGIYVLDARGFVTAKYFEDDYKERDTAAIVLMRQFGLEPGPPPTAVPAKHLQLLTGISNATVSMGRHITLSVSGKLDDRVHVYAPGVQGYIPIQWNLDASPAIQISDARYPPSKRLHLPAIGETVPVYENEFRITRDLIVANEQAVTPLLDPQGNLTLTGSFRYQACDDQKCFLPQTVPLHWTVHYEKLDRERVPADLQHKPR